MQLEITRAPAVDHQGLHELANIIGRHQPAHGYRAASIAKLAGNQSNVLITGESGTGAGGY